MAIYLIFCGTHGVTYTTDRGVFHCPSCGRQPYEKKRVRRFFSLFSIPLVPLGLLGEYVECSQCGDTYRPDVLDFDPEVAKREVEAESQAGIKRTMVLMCLADGVIDDKEVAEIRRIYTEVAGKEIAESQVWDEIARAREDGRQLTEYLSSLVGVLNDRGKELIIRAAFLVAASDGDFQEPEQHLMVELGEALEVSSARLRSVLGSIAEA